MKDKHGREIVARWQARGKAYLELFRFAEGDYGYTGNGCGGVLGNTATNDEEAVFCMERGPVSVLRMDRPSVKRVL